jgi:cell division septum initiation protein DivIVA
MNILQALKREHEDLSKRIERVAAAIAALGGRRKKTRKMSAAASRKISATQKANWRKKRAGK